MYSNIIDCCKWLNKTINNSSKHSNKEETLESEHHKGVKCLEIEFKEELILYWKGNTKIINQLPKLISDKYYDIDSINNISGKYIERNITEKDSKLMKNRNLAGSVLASMSTITGTGS